MGGRERCLRLAFRPRATSWCLSFVTGAQRVWAGWRLCVCVEVFFL